MNGSRHIHQIRFPTKSHRHRLPIHSPGPPLTAVSPAQCTSSARESASCQCTRDWTISSRNGHPSLTSPPVTSTALSPEKRHRTQSLGSVLYYCCCCWTPARNPLDHHVFLFSFVSGQRNHQNIISVKSTHADFFPVVAVDVIRIRLEAVYVCRPQSPPPDRLIECVEFRSGHKTLTDLVQEALINVNRR